MIPRRLYESLDIKYEYSEPIRPTMSYSAKIFIEKYIDLLVNNKYDEFYSKITSTSLAKEITKILFASGLNPKEHMSKCPKGCESLFYYEGKEDPNEKLKTYYNVNPSKSGKSLYTWNTSPIWEDLYVDYKTSDD